MFEKPLPMVKHMSKTIQYNVTVLCVGAFQGVYRWCFMLNGPNGFWREIFWNRPNTESEWFLKVRPNMKI